MAGLALSPIDVLGIAVMLCADFVLLVVATRPGIPARTRWQAAGIVLFMPVAGLLTGMWAIAALFARMGAWNVYARATAG